MPAAAIRVVPEAAPGLVATRQARKVADMRSYLSRLGPQSAAESLRLLRNAYPDAPLSLRVAACGLPDAA